MPEIILVCYKIERGKGSEDGSGYHIARRLVERFGGLTLISRENNVALLHDDPAFAKATLVGVDVPWPLRLVKKGGRGIIPYYYMWQWCVGSVVRRMQRERQYDVVHQLNFHTDWAPHFLENDGGKLIWGPMSHHKFVPPGFLPVRRLRYTLHEVAKYLAKQAFWRLDPFLRAAIRRSSTILYADADVAPPFRASRGKVVFQSYGASIDAFKLPPRPKAAFNVLSVGRLVPLKGFSVALDAFARFIEALGSSTPHPTLTLVGSGELEQALHERCSALGIGPLVKFVPWVDQEALRTHYSEAAAFLYPSFEAQGLVVAEAMAASVPVICLADTGPAFLAGEAGLCVPRADQAETVAALAAALQQLHGEFERDAEDGAYTRRAVATRNEYDRRLDWDVVAENLAQLYDA